MFVYRVTFEGEDPADAAVDAVGRASGVYWEGSHFDPRHPSRHRVLVEASSESEAIARARAVLDEIASFDNYHASAVLNLHGDIRQGPFYRSWDEVDWDADPRRAKLTELQRDVLGSLTNAAEPTWIVLKDLDNGLDRPGLEAVLSDLEGEGIVQSSLEQSGDPGKEPELDRWWSITDYGWELLGFIKSPGYR